MKKSQYNMSQGDPEGTHRRQGDSMGKFMIPKQMQSAQQTIPKHLRARRSDNMMQQISIMNYQPQDATIIAAQSATNFRQVHIGGKDLIIRMLAEVFHVSHNDDGQVRWQQVSTSLVPVSLYSRTTSKWLDYLLTSSSLATANDPANAMSPDSREFLLLMQQFHQSQQQTLSNNSTNIAQLQHVIGEQEQRHPHKESIVFQVIGHDFINGQCKRILNVKIVQPGTRLGQASDFFVYWKEQPTQMAYNQNRVNHLQQAHQFSSSFASSTSFAQPSKDYQPQLDSTDRWLMIGSVNSGDSHTWGLNFASINDAKLFYDICSLNLVDLDFNSEYLKQLALSDKLRQQYRAPSLMVPTTIHQTMISPISTSAMTRQHGWLQQKQPQQKPIEHQQMIVNSKTKSKQHQSKEISASNLKCPTCNHISIERATTSRSRQICNIRDNSMDNGPCPVHGVGAANMTTRSLRTRSRSTNRDGATKTQHRTRSFSTPASPDMDCPVHRKRNKTDSECEHQQHPSGQRDDMKENHHEKCMGASFQQDLTTSGSTVPVKPARGLLRADVSMADVGQKIRPSSMPKNRHRLSTFSHSKQDTKAGYLGHLHSIDHHQQRAFAADKNQRPSERQGRTSGKVLYEQQPINHGAEQRNSKPKKFSTQDASIDRSSQIGLVAMGCGSDGRGSSSNQADEFDALVRRDARLARARYANSKNMKEFLSLDAGGFQSTPKQQEQQWPLRQKFGRQASHTSNKTLEKLAANQRLQQNSTKTDQNLHLSGRAENLNVDKTSTIEKNSSIQPEAIERSMDGRKDYAKTAIIEARNTEHLQQLTDTMRNASTTTEDLPMDARTRERMLKLGSEEVISERTEPKSLSSTIAHNEKERKDERTKIRDERQIRAASLIPEMDQQAALRGREVRSDTGRRRSLERSMCVDFDSSLPASSFRRLPLPHLTSSDANVMTENSESAFCEAITGAQQQKLLNPEMSQPSMPAIESRGLTARPYQRSRRENTQEPNAPSKCYDGAEGSLSNTYQQQGRFVMGDIRRLSLTTARDGSNTVFTQLNDSGHDDPSTRTKSAPKQRAFDNCRLGNERMSTFKSEPDISHLSAKQRQQQAINSSSWMNSLVTQNDHENSVYEPNSDGNCHDEDEDVAYDINRGFFQQQRQQRGKQRSNLNVQIRQQQHDIGNVSLLPNQTIPKRASNLSSYAVPLCTSTSTRRQWQWQQKSPERQCRSCPNSLRRKRRSGNIVDDSEGNFNHGNDYAPTAMIGRSASPVQINRSGECLCRHCEQTRIFGTANKNYIATHLSSSRNGLKHHHQRAKEPRASMLTAEDEYYRIGTEQLQQQGPSSQFSCLSSGFSGSKCRCSSVLCEQSFELNNCHDCNSIYENTQLAFRDSLQQHLSHFPHQVHHTQRHRHHHHQSHRCHRPSEGNFSDVECMVTRSKPMNIGPLAQSTSFTSSKQLADLGSNTDQHQTLSHSPYHVQQRPHTSQSNRSPVHYGLYESEFEEDNEEEVCCRLHGQQQRHNYYRESSLDRPLNVYLRPAVKPVQGYDQTLARASLKSRQRSRSQPPGSSREATSADVNLDATHNAFHLTKSMENVEKLIREVQNELNTIRRHPLGTAFIDMRTGNHETLKKFDFSGAGNSEAELKMAMEEQEEKTKGRQQHHHRSDETALHESGSGRPKISMSSATRRAGQFKCVGAIRKAGFLSVKKWILKRRQSIELARRQGWKRYWVCLRGTALLFHSVIDKKEADEGGQEDSDGRHVENGEHQTDLLTWIQANFPNQAGMLTALLQNEQQQQQQQQRPQHERISRDSFLKSMSQCYIEREPKHLIIIDGAIAQPIPEHPRRDFVFCLSTTFGDAYFFQAGCQLESDNWISAIHNACAASIARDLTRDETIKLFENKIRHLELEAEKKLFLRQRLESRLTSMLSISGPELASEALTMRRPQLAEPGASAGCAAAEESQQDNSKKVTMRSLLNQLSQQLLALDTYIEQVHCEVYQLRCYLSSCGAQNLFYQNIQLIGGDNGRNPQQVTLAHDLPHPKSLLMHVSKPTKLLLLKLGVFTVSSFHAFIHACHGSAETILQKVQQQASQEQKLQQNQQSAAAAEEAPGTLELRIRSRSISETLLARPENSRLAEETEELIELANLRTIRLQLHKCLFNRIRRIHSNGTEGENYLAEIEADTSDDRYSIRDGGDIVIINLKVNPKTNCLAVIELALKIIGPNLNELDFLDYYLRLVSVEQQENSPHEQYYVVKRKEILNDWPTFNYAELLEKSVYRVDLVRSRTDEESTLPFGISIEGQLFLGHFDSSLDVHCSYIEWGSVADKCGLQEEDEFLMINGIPVADLDLMFVECLIQDASELRLVVRSSHQGCPKKATLLDKTTWQPTEDDDDNVDEGDEDGSVDGNHAERADDYGERRNDHVTQQSGNGGTASGAVGDAGSQIISDEYLTSLVCPPPPSQSSAFLRTDQQLLRQRSDLGSRSETVTVGDDEHPVEYDRQGMEVSDLGDSFKIMQKSKSQHQLDDSSIAQTNDVSIVARPTVDLTLTDGHDIAKQLIQRTERLTRLVGKRASPEVQDRDGSGGMAQPHQLLSGTTKTDQNNIERLKKSALELLETEYAYIKQLETISDHYMDPLEGANFLNIIDLKLFNQALVEVLKFQRDFFRSLTKEISNCDETNLPDYFERLNHIVQRLEALEVTDSELQLILQAIAKVFSAEAEKFKLYASYCVAYSNLQRILHPKSTGSNNLPSSSITSMPSALNTFSSSLMPSFGSLAGQRDYHFAMKPVNTFISATGVRSSSIVGYNNNNTEQVAQLKQLTDFLNNLDSSSSSVSFSSLARSSSTLAAAGSSLDKETPATIVAAADKPTHKDRTAHNDSSTASLAMSEQLQQTSSASYRKNVHLQNFESYLIKPIQRIVKYPMLLNSIALSARSIWPNEEQDQQASLQAAVKQMEVVISHVNDSQRVHDEYGAVFDQIERQYLSSQEYLMEQSAAAMPGGTSWNSSQMMPIGPHQPPIALNMGQLLYFGPVDWLNVNEFTSKTKKTNLKLSQVLFVFTSCVVFICKERTKSNRKQVPTLRGAESMGITQQQQQQQSGSGGQMSLTSKLLFQKSSDQPSTEIIRYHSLIPVSEVQVRSVLSESRSTSSGKQTNDTTSQLFRWELFQCSSYNSNSSLLTNKSTTAISGSAGTSKQRNNKNGRVYQLACQTNEERSAFLRKIRFIIRESVRNMSLPLARTLSGKSYNSNKKLSSPIDLTSAVISATSSSSSSLVADELKKRSTNATTNSTCSQMSNCPSQTDSSCVMGAMVTAAAIDDCNGNVANCNNKAQLNIKPSEFFVPMNATQQQQATNAMKNSYNSENIKVNN